MKSPGRLTPCLRLGMMAALTLLLVPSPSRGTPATNEKRVREGLSHLHVPFIANAGQTDSAVAFYAPTFAGTVFVTRDGRIVYSLPGKDAWAPASRRPTSGRRSAGRKPGWSLTETAVGGRAFPTAGDPAATRVSDFRGNDPARWRSGLETLEDVSLAEVWPGIEVRLRAQGRSVEKLFTVQPGADASRIRMSVAGARRLRTDPSGALLASTGPGDVKFTAPVAYQERGGVRREIDVAYDVRGRSYGFRLGAHDPALPVVIDPLLQATYLGGTGNDLISGVAIHPTSGDVYVAGWTSSTNFPGTAGGAQPAVGGGVQPGGLAFSDAFVARLNPALTALIQATYLGGSDNDFADALAIHPVSGEVYVAGRAASTDFPGTAGGAQAASGGGNDAFVARLNATLTTLGRSTYLGGSGADEAYALTIHPTSGDVYVTGYTASTNFPGTLGGAQAASGGGDDVFVARLNAALTALGQATYLGGTGADDGTAVAIHPTSGEVYVTGYTNTPNFPGRFGGAQDFLAGEDDVFVARLNATLTALVQSTYLGGSLSDSASALAIHPASGEVYVAGETDSTNFPGTTGGAQAAKSGGLSGDAFVARLNAALTSVGQATYLGGSGTDYAIALAIQPTSGSVYVSGSTDSTNFPGTAGGAQAAPGGNAKRDGFVARLNTALTTLRQATYLGGSDLDIAAALAIHPASGELYVAGATLSTTFPGTAGGAQPAYGGGFQDAFVARLSPDLAGANASFYTLPPCRVLDTRGSTGSYGGPALAGGATRNFVLTGVCGVPASARSVSVNIAVTGGTNSGFLTIYPGGTVRPLFSNINYQAGQTRANNAVLLLGAAGDVSVYVGQSSGAVDFILDVNGYFQ
ncbi:MAG TPA: hypothetical protein VE007_06000 [Thermoanaerobaculia bacterium]|nr:hypothetical protein [Thermoanaerobaculia bacterium]